MNPNIVILAGGISSRMRNTQPGSDTLDCTLRRDAEVKSKSMIGVGRGNRPFFDYLLNNISEAAYRHVVIVVGERDTSIRQYYEEQGGAKQFPKLQMAYVLQKIPSGRVKPLGTADALLCALQTTHSWKGHKLTVCNSDNLYSVRALRLLLQDNHENAMIDYDRSYMKFNQKRIEQFAVTEKDQDGYLLDIVEKPSLDQIAQADNSSGRIGVSMNIFRFSYDCIYPYLEQVPLHPIRQEKELPTAVKMMIDQHPRSMFTIPLSEHVPDLTMQSDILEVKEYLQKELRG
ncbi:MAG: NTP transferase domain-containing protein [Ignavibacteriae bacterium]|nr:NTP transferase domain-containing protein [Ignavibacteriota bacterium]